MLMTIRERREFKAYTKINKRGGIVTPDKTTWKEDKIKFKKARQRWEDILDDIDRGYNPFTSNVQSQYWGIIDAENAERLRSITEFCFRYKPKKLIL